jgi:hypothetical protein
MFEVTPEYAPGWDQSAYKQVASSMAWASESSAQWVVPTSSSSGGPPTSSFRQHSLASAWDAYLTQQPGELTVQVTRVEESLNTHIQST